jgi:hypothetical protein
MRVISNRERVRARARLCIAVDDHRLIEPQTKVARSSQTIGKRNRASVRRRVAARIV